jgi:hypothetical protein
MMAQYGKLLAAGMGLSLLVGSCGSPQEIGGTGTTTDTLRTRDAEILSIGGRLFSIPSPVQAALAIRTAGLQYNKELTTPLERVDAASGKVAQASLLGMLGADLAYATVHQDGQRAMATMQAIEKLGSRLEVSNAFDRSLMEGFRNNINNEDSLLRFSSKAFSAADRYLKTNDREDVSTLVLAGGWLQSLHLTLSDPNAAQDQKIMDRIGDQKPALDALIDLLGDTEMDPAAAPMLKGLRELRREFDGVQRTYVYQSPVTDAARRVTYINSTTTVTMPEGKLDAIRARVAAIRTTILA